MHRNSKKCFFAVALGDGMRVQCLGIEPYIYILKWLSMHDFCFLQYNFDRIFKFMLQK